MKEKLPFYNEMMVPYHYARAGVSAGRRRFPARGMLVIAVTGTNGKTTTCFMIWKMLRAAGVPAGVMTTVGWGAEKIEQQIEHMTTESAEVLNARIAQLREKGVRVLVLEVTSHALAQGRVFGIPIEVAVLTNVTHDHLDYHRTFRRYVAAKKKLFRKAKFAVLNADEPRWREFAEVVRGGGKNYATYGIKNGDLRAFSAKLGVFGVNYAFGDIRNDGRGGTGVKAGEEAGAGRVEVKLRLPGKFNVYNSLAAVAVGRYLGLGDEEIVRGLAELEEVEGRMNRVEAGQDFTVMVDYAHTPDAFLKVYEAVRGENGEGERGDDSCGDGDSNCGGGGRGKRGGGEKVRRRIITVTGGAGRRDESTRAERGEIAGRESEILIVTEDDSRDEKPEMIAAEFVRGAVKAGMREMAAGELVTGAAGGEELERGAGTAGAAKRGRMAKGSDFGGEGEKIVTVEIDRRKAIRLAIRLARKGDIVLILGKGHEKTILRAGGAVPFEDLKVVREELEEMKI